MVPLQHRLTVILNAAKIRVTTWNVEEYDVLYLFQIYSNMRIVRFAKVSVRHKLHAYVEPMTLFHSIIAFFHSTPRQSQTFVNVGACWLFSDLDRFPHPGIEQFFPRGNDHAITVSLIFHVDNLPRPYHDVKICILVVWIYKLG